MVSKEFNVLIVDDEPEARNLLKSLLCEISFVKVIGEADNAESAVYKIVEHYPNLVLMDINMPGKSGMDLVELIHSRNVDVPVVFISAYEEYAVKAIRNQVYDFLLKPVVFDDLKKIIEKYYRLNRKDLPGKLMEVLNSIKEENKIRINSRYSYILINPSEIVYCVSEDGYVILHLITGKQEVSNSSLTQIAGKLEGQNFYRLGRSMLINIEYIRGIDRSTDSVVLKYEENDWEVFSSHKSVMGLLKTHFNYA